MHDSNQRPRTMRLSPRLVIWSALAGNLAIATAKFVAAAITGSAAMTAEGIHSVIDTSNQVLLLYGLKRARRPPDEDFPFGYGKEIYFWSFVVAVQIFTFGAGAAIVQGGYRLAHPEPLERPLVNFGVLAVSLVFEGATWLLALKDVSRTKGKWTYVQAVRHGKDPSRFMVLFEDSAALVGLIIAFVALLLQYRFGWGHCDGAASILIGATLTMTAIWLAYETKGLLIGEAANREVVADIHRIAEGFGNVIRVPEALTMHVGPENILVTMRVVVEGDASAEEVRESVSALHRAIRRAHPRVKRIFVETIPEAD